MGQLRDKKFFFGGLNKDDNPDFLPEGDYVDATNIRTGSSEEQHGFGPAETLQGEIGVVLGVVAEIIYYGESIGGQFIYTGIDEIKIGTQVWMKKNVDTDYPGSKVYDDDEANRSIYGGLYTHDQIIQSDFCPAGWRVPTVADIDVLLNFLGGEMIAGGKLKEAGIQRWDTPNTGASDEYGFRALPGGKFDLLFELLGNSGLLWLLDEGLEPPVALSATNITTSSFDANWDLVVGATGYYLDVAIDIDFTNILTGFNNLDVGNVLSYSVAGLGDDVTYFYRIRTYDEYGSSENSNIINLDTLDIVDIPYVYMDDGTTYIRKGVRNGYFVIDISLTPTGFAGVEYTDWVNIKNIKLMGSSTPDLKDKDGNIYTTVNIGTQEWIIENLKTTKYADGTVIPNVTSNALWITQDGTVGNDGAYCWYNNDIINKAIYGALYNQYAIKNKYSVKYGLLYNWYAATDARNIANTGWHVPTLTEFETLITYLGGENVAGGKLKETGYTHWNYPNTGATNEVEFNGRGSGYRTDTFYDILNFCPLWSSTEADANYAEIIQLSSIDDDVLINNSSEKHGGAALRLIKDNSSLTSYTGNDGTEYQTVRIGDQVWMAENLCETKYRNTDPIPEVTDNNAWVALSTGAYCAYNNDMTNAIDTSLIRTFAYLERDGVQEAGWRVPSRADLLLLEAYLGGASVAGGHLKEDGVTHWNVDMADNSSGFTALPAGARGWLNGNFSDLLSSTWFWTTDKDWANGYSIYLFGTDIVSIIDASNGLATGFSVRLVRDI